MTEYALENLKSETTECMEEALLMQKYSFSQV
jgi:hypothetical protein